MIRTLKQLQKSFSLSPAEKKELLFLDSTHIFPGGCFRSWVYHSLQLLEPQNPQLVQQVEAWMELQGGQVALTCCVLNRPVNLVKHDVLKLFYLQPL